MKDETVNYVLNENRRLTELLKKINHTLKLINGGEL